MTVYKQELPESTIKDQQTTVVGGKQLRTLPEGVSLFQVNTYVDERGMTVEMFDPRWQYTNTPLKYAYFYTVMPKKMKGWGLHKLHEDRYFIISGRLKMYLYDDRPESSTYQQLFTHVLSDSRRELINILPGIWHLVENIGETEAFVANFPTELYDHETPDKYRLPPNNDYIPYTFDNPSGW